MHSNDLVSGGENFNVDIQNIPRTIIGIMGMHNQGKTATINHIVDLMRRPLSGYTFVSSNLSYLNEFLFSNGEISIGILDSDYPNLMTAAIQRYIAQHQCRIIICRCCFPQLASTVNTYLDGPVRQMGFRIFKMSNYFLQDKTPQPLHQIMNTHSGNQIFNTVEEILLRRL